MVEIKELKIKKGMYSFESRKRFQYVLRFKVIEKKPLEQVMDVIKLILRPKKAKPKEAAIVAGASAPSGGFNIALVAGAIFLAILIILAGFIWFQFGGVQTVIVPYTPIEKGSISNKVIEKDVLTAGPRGTQDHLAQVFVEYNTTGMQNYSANIKTYDYDLPNQVFVLNSDRVEATNYSDFMHGLRLELQKRGIVLNEISVEQLATVPRGAEIIIPSGVIPVQLLVGRSNITRLLDGGVTVIYIGQSFKSMLNGSQVLSTPDKLSSGVPVVFDERAAPTCTGNFSLFQPLYRASGGSSSSLVYGCISVIRRGSGTILFVPQTLDGGWRINPRAAASEIARIVIETPWVLPDGEGSFYQIGTDNDTGEISGRQLFFSSPYTGTTRTVRLYFKGYSETGTVFEDIKIVRAEKKTRGEFYVSQLSVTSTHVTDEKIRMNAKLSEPNPASPSMFIVFFNSSGVEAGRDSRGNINTQASDVNMDVPIYLDTGEYKVTLEDDVSRVYAASYLKVESVSIGNPRIGKKASIYVFDVSTPTSLKTLTVDVDQGKYVHTYNNVPPGQLEVDVTSYTGGDSLSYGNHTFIFKAGGLVKEVSYVRSLPPAPFPPELVLVFILAGAIVGVGIYFARREKIYYGIDVPDFPPVSRTKIALSLDTVLSVFQKVNDNYRWEYTPLAPTEVRNGFKNIFVRGNPIYITDYNTEFLLNDLTRRKKIKEFLGYYGLIGWETKSGKSIRYLAMLRKLRDICVNNAVPFTPIGESKICDSEITVVGQQMLLHFYEKTNTQEVVSRALSTVKNGITIVLFKDDSEKRDFSSLLNSSSEAPIVMKMEVESSSVLLLTYPELEKMVQEFKGV